MKYYDTSNFFHYYYSCYGDLWYYCNCFQCQKPHTYKTLNLINCWNNNKGLRILHKLLVNKAVAGYERTHSNFERIFTVGKILSNSIACHREIVLKGSKCMQQIHCCLYFKKLPQPPQPSATTTLISQQSSASMGDPLLAKRYNLLKSQIMVGIFKQ